MKYNKQNYKKYNERYLTNTKDVEVTDRVIEALLMTMINESPKVIANPDDYQARANIMWAGMMAHNNCCGVGRDQDWASHDLEHELSALYDCAHGAGLAVVFPAWMEYNMNHDVMRFAQVASRVWGCAMDFQHPEVTAKAGINACRNFLKSIGMPQTMAELGGKEEDIEAMAHTACYGNGNKGTITVYNYLTGQVICMTSAPTYDVLNKPSDIDTNTSGKYDGIYMNRAISGVFTPGSTFKVVTAICAIENIPDLTYDFIMWSDDQFITKDTYWEDTTPRYMKIYDKYTKKIEQPQKITMLY